MPVIEMEEDILSHMGGRLAPKADQKQFASTWAIKEGDGGNAIGFPSQRDLQGAQPFGHGSNRAISGYMTPKFPLADGKTQAEHIVTIGGARLVEMVTDRPSAELRDQWNGTVSRNRIEAMKDEELAKLDRLGLKDSSKSTGNMQERVVQDDDPKLQ